MTAQRQSDTLLAFLTSSCASCRPFWEMLSAGPPDATLGVRLVVTTPSRSMESEREVRRLLPAGVELEMSSEAWFTYGVTKAPSFVLLRDYPLEQGAPARATEALGPASASTPAELVEVLRGWRYRLARARPGEAE